MATTSSNLEEGLRPRLNLLDLPQEVKDRIYGYVVYGSYRVLPQRPLGYPARQGDDFRHESILRVAKRTNYEAMQVLQRRSWFLYNMRTLPYYWPVVDEAPTRHMMNVELIVGQSLSSEQVAPVLLSFAGSEILRRTCHIVIPRFSLNLAHYAETHETTFNELRPYFQLIKLMTGFTTVVLQINLHGKEKIRRDEEGYYFDRAKLLTDIEENLGPALGPAMPCNPVWHQKDGMNFAFYPRRFLAK